jgi:hypothetical protein
MSPEETEALKALSQENASTQRMSLEIRTILSQFIKDELTWRREGHWV